ncbi:MAG TPA: hypothetical protein DDZ42_16905 [Candidatus Rokubacteria bacterium]|nr:hypothetical protein [Candidatus Rokubacteria bacterium]HBH03572.1 hypothetical protein [Candidatus Rokubacteria bacterium]
MGYFADVFSLYETKPMKRSRSPRARPRPGRNGSRTHQSLQRGLSVLEAIAATGGVAALAEVVRRTALPRSTAHHLVRALVDFGYLDQDGDARPYRLAPRLLRLTGRPWGREDLAELAAPALDALSRRTGEGASLAILRDTTVTVIAKRDPEGPVRVVQEVGGIRPIHCTAVGKALVAWLPPPELDRVLAGAAFERKTARTIPTPAGLRDELARIRRRGYAIDNEEHIDGIRCIALPVRDYSGEVGAALCIVGPKSRIPQRRFAALRAALAEEADRLSARLGFVEPPGARWNGSVAPVRGGARSAGGPGSRASGSGARGGS